MENSKNNYSDVEIHAEDASNFICAPAGTHVARCIQLIQLGTQKQEYQGKPGRDRKKIILGWELPEELHVFDDTKGPQPYFIQHNYALVLGEKSTFYLHMKSWTGGEIDRNFNPLIMLGKPCLLTITHKPSSTDASRTNAKITAISPLMKNQVCPPQINPMRVLLFKHWEQDVFDKLSPWAQKTIEGSPEYKALGLPLANGNHEGIYRQSSIEDLPY